MSRSYRRLQRWLIVGLSLFAFAWRLHALGAQSLWRDEADAVYFALRHLPETLSMFVSEAQNGALFFLALRLWLRLAGASEFALRYPAVLFSLLSVPLLWQVGRRLMPGRPSPATSRRSAHVLQVTVGSAPLLAAAFLAVNPYQLWYGQDGKMYAEVTFLSLLAAWFWLKGIGCGGWRSWFGYLVAVSLAIYTHLLTVLLIPLGILWFFFAWPQSRAHKAGYLLSLGGLTLPYLPLALWQYSFLIAPTSKTALPFYPLNDVLESVFVSQVLGAQEPDRLLGIAPVMFLGATGLLLGFLEISPRQNGSLSQLSGSRRHLIIVTWLLFPVLGIYLLSLRQPVFLPRYVIWLASALMMLIALGVQLLWNSRGRLARPLAAAMAIYVLLFWFVAGQQQKELVIKPDLRAAIRTVTQSRGPDDLLILQAPYLESSYRYYSSDQDSEPAGDSDSWLGRWAGGPFTNNDLDDNKARRQVAKEMAEMTDGVTNIWVLLSEANAWDERQLMTEWLDHRGSLVNLIDYQGVEVRLYRLP